jgi:hypothetical protein
MPGGRNVKESFYFARPTFSDKTFPFLAAGGLPFVMGVIKSQGMEV